MLQSHHDSVHLIGSRGAWVAYKLLGVKIPQKPFRDFIGLATLGFLALEAIPGVMFWIVYVYPFRSTLS